MQRATFVRFGMVALSAAVIWGTGGALKLGATPPAPPPSPSANRLSLNPNPPSAPVRLVFVHHSTGEDWLSDEHGGLGIALRDNNYFVSDTNYCWGPSDVDVNDMDASSCPESPLPVPIGSHTDLGHWYNWFVGAHRSTYQTALYAEGEQHAYYSRLETAPAGENRVILFKSCFPNSTLYGNPDDPPTVGTNPLRGEGCCTENYTVGNVKALYSDLLSYFATRQDKLFIAITAPPLDTSEPGAAQAANARALNRWLAEKWLNNYPYRNVAVFDFYTVLTTNGGNATTNDLGQLTGNHHRYRNGTVEHITNQGGNIAAYTVAGDSHPTAAGDRKASAEFLPLLNIALHCWLGDGDCPLLMGRDVANGTPTPSATCACVTPSATAPPPLRTATATPTHPTNTPSPRPTATVTRPPATPTPSRTRTATPTPSAGPSQSYVCFLPLVLKSYARAGTATATAAISTRTPTPTLAPGAFCVSPQPSFITDTIVRQVPALAEPAARVPFRDAALGSCVVRVTDYAQDRASDDPGGLKNEYARVQSFNADESRILVRGTASTWYLYDARTLQPLGQMGVGGLGDPRWDATDPEVLYYFEDTRLLRYNVRTQGDAALVHDFGPDFPGQTLAAVWMRYEGSPSRDGRTWGLMAENEDWLPVALLIYDQQTDQVIARRTLNPAQGDIDSVTISPLGGYFLASYEPCPAGQTGTLTQPCGLMVYDRSLTEGRGLLPAIGHCDIALDAQGREVLLYQDTQNDHIAMLNLASGAVTALWPIDFSHTALGLHFSGRALARPGWAVVSTYNGGRPTSYTWMDDQVFIVELRAGGRVVRLAHTHSQYDDSAGQDYWAEPHASANRDLTRILFTSNWGRAATDQVDMYLIALPPDWSTRLP